MKYRVMNPLLSVRIDTNPEAENFNDDSNFISWQAGDVMTEWPEHTAIKEWLAAGHIEEVADGED